MANECIKCRKVISGQSMTLRCGEPIHLKCFKKIVQRRYRQICHRRPKRMRVRGRLGIPAYCLLPRCPGCRQFLNVRDLELLEERLRNRRQRIGEEEERSQSVSSSTIEEYAEYIRNILMSDSSEEEE